MRKAIITTLSVLIVLLSIACNTRVNYNKYLIAIDSLIVQQPDTALSMLEAFPTNSLQTQADSAYYGLLMTEARDKNYIIQTNDSLIQSALTYYNGTNDIEKRARAPLLFRLRLPGFTEKNRIYDSIPHSKALG